MNLLEQKAKNDNKIMKILKVSELSHVLAKTNRGELVLRLRLNGTAKDYRFVMDAVPVSDEQNAELIRIFYGE